MATTHNLGFPRIGGQRELKFALEDYWAGKPSRSWQSPPLTCVGATGSNRPGWISYLWEIFPCTTRC